MNSNYCNPVNIGNPDELTIKEVASKIIELTNSKSKLIHLPLPKDDPTNRPITTNIFLEIKSVNSLNKIA